MLCPLTISRHPTEMMLAFLDQRPQPGRFRESREVLLANDETEAGAIVERRGQCEACVARPLIDKKAPVFCVPIEVDPIGWTGIGVT